MTWHLHQAKEHHLPAGQEKVRRAAATGRRRDLHRTVNFSRDWSDRPVCCDVDIILLQFWYYRSGWQCNQWGLIWHFRIHCVYCACCNISGGGFLVRQ